MPGCKYQESRSEDLMLDYQNSGFVCASLAVDHLEINYIMFFSVQSVHDCCWNLESDN